MIAIFAKFVEIGRNGGEKMKNKKTFVGMAIMIAVLMLGVGYAAISNVTLNISGTLSATPSDENFKVKFTGTPSTDKTEVANSEAATVEALISSDLLATIEVSGLAAKGDKVEATYTIENGSPDLNAALSASTTNSNSDYFSISYEFAEESIPAKGTTTITVTVELIKTPVDTDEEAEVSVEITASPVQP